MNLRVRWQQRAIDELSGVSRSDRRTAGRIMVAVDRFAEHGVGDVKKLHGPANEWRLRVGDWRIRFQIDADAQAVVVLRVLPRGRAYRD